MKKAYFFINGFLLKKNEADKEEVIIKLDDKNIYQIENFGVCKNFESCKSGAIYDLTLGLDQVVKIIPNTYVAIFEIDLDDEGFNSIYEQCHIADFDILRKIFDNQNKLIYSIMFDENEQVIENFIEGKN